MFFLSSLFPAALATSGLLYPASLARILWSSDSNLKLPFPWNPRELHHLLSLERNPCRMLDPDPRREMWFYLPAPPRLNVLFCLSHKGPEWFSDCSMEKVRIFLKEIISQVLKKALPLHAAFPFQCQEEKWNISMKGNKWEQPCAWPMYHVSIYQPP